MDLKSLFKEPLVHFLLLGALLFILFDALSPGAVEKQEEVVVSSAKIELLSRQFERVWQRPPNADELRSLIDGWVREEILYREGALLGLDKNDQVIRRRVAQKMMFMSANTIPNEPSEAELENWLDSHEDRYELPSRYTFRQVYFDPRIHGDMIDEILRKAVDELQSRPEKANSIGDPNLLPHRLNAVTRVELSAKYGAEFAGALADVPIGKWAGPIYSGFGAHLVYMEARSEARRARLVDVRDDVLRDFLRDESEKTEESIYRDLRSRYTVRVASMKDEVSSRER